MIFRAEEMRNVQGRKTGKERSTLAIQKKTVHSSKLAQLMLFFSAFKTQHSKELDVALWGNLAPLMRMLLFDVFLAQQDKLL